jgi:GntR family transcriptional regulator, transcriptional repressor for pyruvate dehydrogenase complex
MADEVGIRVGRKRTPKAGEQIAAILRSEIVSGRVADGERLGSGDELLERFGVSRPTLREALRVLEAESMITIERGTYGGVIARRPGEQYIQKAMMTVLESRGVALADVYEARTIIEPASAGRLAESKGRKAAVRKLQSVIDLEEESIDDPVVFASNNVKFHEMLVAASGNQTLVLLSDVLHEIVEQAVTRLTERDGTAKGLARRRTGVESQRRLLELIAAGKSAEAEVYWREYMRMVGQIMLRGGNVGVIVDHSQSAND